MSLPALRTLFIIASAWNLLGAGFGYFNTEFTYGEFFGRELTDPLVLAIYQGAWGTTLVYFIGYLIVASDPLRHWGIVLVGGIGKVGFAAKLLQLYFDELAQPVVWVVIIGDFIFATAFVVYFIHVFRVQKLGRGASRQ
ncbi:MAG: hypothetical protein AAFQ82_10025 [Myxococcota bacterium]